MAQKNSRQPSEMCVNYLKLFKSQKIAFWALRGKFLRFLSVMLYMTRNFHSNISVWKTFPRVQSTKNKNSIFLLPDGNAYWWILIIVVHLWRNFPLSPVLLLTCVLCFFFCLFYYMIIILSCSFFLPSSFLVLLLTSRFIFFSTVTDSFCAAKWKRNLNI